VRRNHEEIINQNGGNMTTQTRPKMEIVTKCTLVKLALIELKAYSESLKCNNAGLIHRMKHIEKLCIIHGLSEHDVQRLTDEIFDTKKA